LFRYTGQNTGLLRIYHAKLCEDFRYLVKYSKLRVLLFKGFGESFRVYAITNKEKVQVRYGEAIRLQNNVQVIFNAIIFLNIDINFIVLANFNSR